MRLPQLARFFLLLCCSLPSFARIVCPDVLGDHMVLQQGKPVPLWGTAEAGSRIIARFGAHEASCLTDEKGNWQLELPAMPASWESRTLLLSGDDSVEFRDVLVGEVWLCSGQSNMEKNIGPRKGQQASLGWEEDLALAEIPGLRLFQMPRLGKLKTPGGGLCWLPASGETLKQTNFSALAFHYGKELIEKLKVPVGLLHASFGGTRIEVWIPKPEFAKKPELRAFAESAPGVKVEKLIPSSHFNSMIAPLAPYALRGFLWYQGESNCMNAETTAYTDKMELLVTSWRREFKAPDAPFHYVLIAPWHYSRNEWGIRSVTDKALPCFWEAQIAALSIPNSALVTCSDLSPDFEDIHPTNKTDLGKRLAWMTLGRCHGFKELLPKALSPSLAAYHIQGKRLILEFAGAPGGLRTLDHQSPGEFEIAGADGEFHPAQAKIEGSTVALSSPEVSEPVHARHAFREDAYPKLCNQYGVPALPFRTDTLPLVLLSNTAPANEVPEQRQN